MTSDCLLVFDNPLSDSDLQIAVAAIYQASSGAMVSRNLDVTKILLLKFDPAADDPWAILRAVRDSGFAVKLAGG